MKDIEKIDWQKMEGLIPVITQDSSTNEVLMLGYTNKEALQITLKTGFAHYFSRSKQRVWKKGESSNHTQKIVDIMLDCDNDTLLFKVIQEGVACHTGRKSCFFTSLKDDLIKEEIKIDTTNTYSVIDNLYHIIQSRKNDSVDKSYTAKLLKGDTNSMLKKVVEEAGEFCFAIKDKNTNEAIYEAADISYHILVALASLDINPDRVKQELKRRFSISGIEEKNRRKK
ncbi:bifunctional phosphoribosyl-AMP cyclohydrolase/phosphoribosyl-ATP pyrophosphatase [Aliarcobacter trophiarum LMG 25534]|uniref:Histidine biosynthesis bifunctional protein HisIE n=1 Tax=Aliarcobacter trophiarum LMG 25534 TaxID=1032241 RepID=A0AAD0QHU3_9BACT|nr:bifunctional phosphoribosyl-AMP cyclohydrolase/phosphoribosyl-ATP diphosphatase HisIE [Aliarcobacter trophiarum]AXK47981.1 phosphoribosyl-AMP cyclohydrolase / phosphoribosyl-ATP pyrophosphatase [Aliarcobacter trophiarum LMG 25534]RXI26076.1 bifunctional phosphoribosyl-AMP cyclohydrolase/phosphoribosyl-ATP pyrophosphatase [Aliarcobacter trophiarum]RXJ89306.1 bifunctional phosphoribosyl-AMP cyclohydrolase/phosphoribosyl-ATP pyrophosphatase [Aliarcobacter trophiarum LMG 25534]